MAVTLKYLVLHVNFSSERLLWSKFWLLLCLSFSTSADTVALQSWLTPFNNDSAKRSIAYQWETKTAIKQRICAIIPSSSSSYWFAINYALVKKARAMDVSLKVYHISDNVEYNQQTALVKSCLNFAPHSIIINSQLASQINKAVQGLTPKPTIVLIGRNLVNANDTASIDTLNASSSASYADIGLHLAKYMNKMSAKGNKAAAIFPGDRSEQYVGSFVEGFIPQLNKNKYTIKDVVYTSNRFLNIKNRLTTYLNNHLDTSVIIGSALVAEAAVEVLAEMSLSADVKIFSYELSAQVYRDIKRDNITASVSSPPIIQGFLAIDMAEKFQGVQNKNKHISPVASIVDRNNVSNIDISQVFAPYGYRETLEVN